MPAPCTESLVTWQHVGLALVVAVQALGVAYLMHREHRREDRHGR